MRGFRRETLQDLIDQEVIIEDETGDTEIDDPIGRVKIGNSVQADKKSEIDKG